MADYDLGTARGHIEIDSTGAVTGIGKAETQVNQLDTTLRKASSSMMAAGGVLSGAGAAIAAGFALAINSAADFEQSISGIAAVSGASGEELDGIRKKALQLGADTVFSAKQAADGMEELIKAGLSTTDVMNGAADAAVALAAAGGIPIKEAATIAANAMNQFGIAASDLPHVADVLAGAANASAADVSQLGEALAQVGAVARTVGMTFEDTVTALSALADAGIKGSDAGTSLKTFLVNLVPTTQQATEKMLELGIATYQGGVSADEYKKALGDLKQEQDDVANAQKTLNELLEDFKAQDADQAAKDQAQKMDDVKRATDGVNEAQQKLNDLRARQAEGASQTAEQQHASALREVQSATDALQTAESNLNQLRERQAASGEPKTELERITRAQQLQDATDRVTKATQSLSEARQAMASAGSEGPSISAQQQLRDATEEVAKSQQKLNEARNEPDTQAKTQVEQTNRAQQLRDATDRLNESQAKLNATNKILEGGVGQLSSKFFDQNGKLKSLADVSQVLQDALKGQTEQQKLANLQTLFGTDAIRAASVLSREGAGGIRELYGELSKTTAADVAGKRMQNLKGDMEQLKGSLDTAAITMGEVLQPIIRSLAQTITGLVNWFASLSPSTQKWIAIILGSLAGLLTFAGTLLIIGGVLLKFVNIFLELRRALAIVKELQLVTKAMQALNASFLTNPVFLIVAALVLLGVALYELYQHSETFRNAVDALWQGIQSAFDAIVGAVSSAVDFIKKYWLDIVLVLTGPIGIIIELWRKFGGDIVSILTGLPEKVGGFFKMIGEAIINEITSIPEQVGFVIGFIIGSFVRMGLETLEAMIEWGPQIIEAIIGELMSLPDQLLSIFNQLLNLFVSLAANAFTSATAVGTNVYHGIIDWIEDLPSNAWNFLKAFVDNLISIVSVVWDNAVAIGKNIYHGIIDWVKNLPDEMVHIIGNVIKAIKDAIGQAFDAVKDFASGIWKGFVKGLFGSPHTKIEYAMWDMTDNVQESIAKLKSQVSTLQSIGADIPKAVPSVQVAASVSGVVQPVAAGVVSGATGGSNVPVQGGDHYEFHQVMADPIEISNEITWKKQIRMRG